MTSLKPGDIVYMATGSPLMSVKMVDDKHATCLWFDSTYSHVHMGTFHRDQLKKHETKPDLKLVDGN